MSQKIRKITRRISQGQEFTNTSTDLSSPIQSLPDELCLEVFSYLPPVHHLLVTPRVCRRWSSLHRHACLYRRLTFAGVATPATSVAVQLVKMAGRGLRTLDMSRRTDSNEILRHVAICNPCLECLVLRHCNGTPSRNSVSSICLMCVTEYCSRLQRLSLRGTVCNSKQFYRSIGRNLPLLKSIDFGSSWYCEGADLMTNADSFHHLQDLRIFTEVSDDVVNRFCERFRDSLKTVKIKMNECTDRCLSSLGRCGNLERLYLYRAEAVTDEGVVALGALPGGRLRQLVVSHAYRVTARGWTRLFQSDGARGLRKLTLEFCENVDDSVAVEIVGHLRGLREVSLERCWNVSPRCCREMRQHVQDLGRVQVLGEN